MKYFSYDEGDSAFPLVWKVNKGPARVGMRAGTMRKDGYVTTSLNSVQYLMHRLVWSINGNSFTPGFVVDHKEGNPSENLIGDLQEISHAANLHKANYSRVSSRSASGYRGVSKSKCGKRWRARLKENDKEVSLGVFDTELEAAAAYNKKATELRGEFAVLNNLKRNQS